MAECKAGAAAGAQRRLLQSRRRRGRLPPQRVVAPRHRRRRSGELEVLGSLPGDGEAGDRLSALEFEASQGVERRRRRRQVGPSSPRSGLVD